MICPFCQTDNREDRDTCYVCGKDISTIRLVVNKARQHYNDALEHAERGRNREAIDELKNAIDLDASLVQAHVVLGTLFAREGNFDEARESWDRALSLHPDLKRAHIYLERVDTVAASIPTIRFYRWVAVGMFLLALMMAVAVIYTSQPDPATGLLHQANALVAEGRFGEAEDRLNQAHSSARQGSAVAASVHALQHALALDVDQQVRLIQDLKYRQLYPEALDAIRELEGRQPSSETRAVLESVRADIMYYYHSLIAQLYTAYTDGGLDFETLYNEISLFLTYYPNSPEAEDIRRYLTSAERLEVQAVFGNVHRQFMLDANVESAVESIREIAGSPLGQTSSFHEERQLFIEEILSTLFNMFTGYLEQEDFVRASILLYDIERVNAEFRDVVDVDISGAVDLAWSVLRDARMQASFRRVEELIDQGELLVAEEAVWFLLKSPDLSQAERIAIQGLWWRMNKQERLQELLRSVDDEKVFNLEITDEQSSETLALYHDFEGKVMPQRERTYLSGLAAAAALARGDDDLATSISLQLQQDDPTSTVSDTVNRMVNMRINDQ